MLYSAIIDTKPYKPIQLCCQGFAKKTEAKGKSPGNEVGLPITRYDRNLQWLHLYIMFGRGIYDGIHD